MKSFEFNRLYIIESLKDGEEKTGNELYNDLKAFEKEHPNLQICYHDISSALEWDELMTNLLELSRENNVHPIIHLEIHGCQEGIEFTNGEYRTMEQIGEQFRQINIATGCNLFLTLGVCEGLYVVGTMHLDKAMPFCGVVGSDKELEDTDIRVKFAAFYQTFFETFDIAQSVLKLYRADSGNNGEYRYIPIDEMFYKIYQDYLDKECTDDALKKRANDAIEDNVNLKHQIQNRQQRRKYQRAFAKQEKKSRKSEFEEAVCKFFMTDNFPQNNDRFNVPKTFEELKAKYDKLIV